MIGRPDVVAGEFNAAGGPRLAEFLDLLCVDRYWLKGHHIVWMTGQQNARVGVGRDRYTHCSAFVAAAAMRLGIYVLRPPFHDEMLLASAQDHWLRGYARYEGQTAAAAGWSRIGRSGGSGVIAMAQSLANQGKLVLASYAQRPLQDDPAGHPIPAPGHIALLRPSPEDGAGAEAPGLLVCAAGHINGAALPIEASFQEHVGAWPDNIDFYAHDTALERDLHTTPQPAP